MWSYKDETCKVDANNNVYINQWVSDTKVKYLKKVTFFQLHWSTFRRPEKALFLQDYLDTGGGIGEQSGTR